MIGRWYRPPVGFFLGVVLFVASSVEGEEGDVAPALGVSGSYRAFLDYQQDEIQDDDLDFDNYLRLNVWPILDERVRFHFSGRVRADLGDESSIDDALSRSDGRIFQSYLELEELPERTRFRIGRQWVHEVDGVHVDGIRAELIDLSGIDLMGFGGRPVSAYGSTDGEDVFGGALGYRPFRGTEFRFTGVRSDEKNPIVDDQIGFYWFQRLTASSRFHADYRILNRRSKDFRFNISGFIPSWPTELTGSYYRRINRTPVPDRDDVLGRRYSEFYRLLGSVEELDRYGLTATRYFGDRFALNTGFSLVDIRGRDSPGNRDTDRYFAGLHVYHLFLESLDFSVTGNYIHAELNGDETYTVEYADGSEEVTKEYERDEEAFLITGEVSYRFSPAFRAAAGSIYGDHDFASSVTLDQEYSPEFLTNDRGYLVSGLGGRFITRTYFAEAWWRIRENISSRFLVEWDHSRISADNDTDDYVRLAGSVTYVF